MADDAPPSDTPPPALITPLESGYIRIAIAAALPAINWVIYATNLDQVLHITALTTNQVWQACNSALTVASVVAIVVKRIKEGRDPKSTASKIVMSKPDTPDEFAAIAKDIPPVQAAPPDLDKTTSLHPTMTDEELMALLQKRMAKPMQKPVSGEGKGATG
jgi:hypothetical protein